MTPDHPAAGAAHELSPDDIRDQDIAVIGMAGRFPGADSLDAFWDNLRDGVESATVFTDEQLRAAGVPAELTADPRLVRRRPVLDDVDLFDAAFFGYTPREAEIIDPQQRIFLECAWEALESAGYDPGAYDGAIGVFGGGGPDSYFLNHVYANASYLERVGRFQALLGNDKDFLAPRTSYKLDLRGPSISVLTGCSSSLVAVHLAAQSLLSGESDMALAGGVTIHFPQGAGYVYNSGGVNAPDGHCRAFDAEAAGTIPGDGAGILLLKRLTDAVADGDTVLGVIRGTAVNNDGALKAGFTAPSVRGQAEVIAEAMSVADVEPTSIGYVEAHGTGTRLGDAVEIAALTEAFATDLRGFCALGTVKPNIGHTDTAAGVLGLVKVLLSYRHGLLPPTVNCKEPNPEIGFEHTPFRPNTGLAPWERGRRVRRAGVSSFSVGGTNAHVVTQEPPARAPSGPSRPWQLLPVSARTPAALDEAASALADRLRTDPGLDLADAAYTLQIGRQAFDRRAVALCRDRADAVDVLARNGASRARLLHGVAHGSAPVAPAFLFPGQGSQYAGMGRELYDSEPGFRARVDECCDHLEPLLGQDLRTLLYPDDTDADAARADARLGETWLTQPALFVTEYALATTLMDWGVRPAALAGHSIGELVAACLAEVMSPTTALDLVAARGRLVQARPAGAMLAVALSEAAVAPLLGDALSVAAVNGPTQVVLAGPDDAVTEVAARLADDGVRTTRLRTSHAFHSAMMGPAAEEFAVEAARYPLAAPAIPIVSGTTGTWLTAEEAVDPRYWARQLRLPVRFADVVDTLRAGGHDTLVETGPGSTLRGLVVQRSEAGDRASVVATLPPRARRRGADEVLAEALGRLWCTGVDVDWAARSRHEVRYRIPLPTYPFQRERYLIDLPGIGAARSANPNAESGAASGPDAVAEPASPVSPAPASESTRYGRPDLPTEYVAPETESEILVAEIWREVVGIETVGVHDNFFDLGGHSLLAAQVVSRIAAMFPIEFTVADLLGDAQTIAETVELIETRLVEVLEQLSDEDASALLGDLGGGTSLEQAEDSSR